MNLKNPKLIIIILVAVIAALLTWFVLIDNYIVPQIIAVNQLSFQNGYETGGMDAILGIMQQSMNCEPLSLWSGNSTVQLINVECLSVAPEN